MSPSEMRLRAREVSLQQSEELLPIVDKRCRPDSHVHMARERYRTFGSLEAANSKSAM